MKQIVNKHILLLCFILFYLSPAVSQDFLVQDTENDLDRQTRFIEAQGEIIIGNADGAIEIYKNLLKKDVNDHEAAFFLGKLYLNQKDLINSIKYFSLALANEKENPWYYIWAADAYLKNDQFDQATKTMENLVHQFPDEKEYYDRLEYLYRDSRQYRKQIKLLDRMIERFGFHKNDVLGQVQAYENLDKPEKALELLTELSERFPRDLFILNMLANYYEKNGNEDSALQVYKQILSVNPNDSRANLAVVESNNQDDTSETGKLLGKKAFFQNGNIDFDTQFSEILSYFQQDLSTLPEDELDALNQVSIWLLQSHPDNPKALSLRADILAQMGMNAEAADYYIQTIEIHPDNYMVWEQLLWSLKELQRWEALNDYADEATLYFPNKAAIYLFKGEAGYHLGDAEEAVFDLETCQTLSGQDPVMNSNAQGLIGLVLCTNDKPQKADAAFAKARDILDKNPNIDYYESICLLQKGAADHALEVIEKALDKVPQKPEYLVQKAKILHRSGLYQKSLETLIPLTEKTTYFPVYQWIALNYKKLNQEENAQKYHKMAEKYGAPLQTQISN